jgi:hypothetical protein
LQCRGFEALDFVDVILLDSYSISSRPEEKEIKWPMNASVIVPEVSPWLLAPGSAAQSWRPRTGRQNLVTRMSTSKLGCYSWRMANCANDQIPRRISTINDKEDSSGSRLYTKWRNDTFCSVDLAQVSWLTNRKLPAMHVAKPVMGRSDAVNVIA